MSYENETEMSLKKIADRIKALNDFLSTEYRDRLTEWINRGVK